MKRPKEIRIGHMTLTVEQNANECDALGSNAHILIDARRIVVRPGLVKDLEREALLHEVLHGVMTAAHLEWDDDDDEERIVGAMATVLLDTLQRNPQLTSYLLDQE